MWQVLFDNLYSNQNIAVYPGLAFIEAAYMPAYLRTGAGEQRGHPAADDRDRHRRTGADSDGIRPIASL